jgi:hypothetical protein
MVASMNATNKGAAMRVQASKKKKSLTHIAALASFTTAKSAQNMRRTIAPAFPAMRIVHRTRGTNLLKTGGRLKGTLWARSKFYLRKKALPLPCEL